MIHHSGAARGDLWPKYAHAGRGQECGAPKLIVRISGGLCIVCTAQRSGNWALVLCDCHFSEWWETGRDGEEEPVYKQHGSLPVKLTNSDRQLTHSFKQRTALDCMCRGRRKHILMSAPEGSLKSTS